MRQLFDGESDCVSRHGRSPVSRHEANVLSRKPQKAVFKARRSLRASSVSKPFRMRVATSVSRNSIVRHRNAFFRRSRCRRMRIAALDGERDGTTKSGGVITIFGPLADDARRKTTDLPGPPADARLHRNARADRKRNTYRSSHVVRNGLRQSRWLRHSDPAASKLTCWPVATAATDEPWLARLSQLSPVSQCLPLPTWLTQERHRCRIQMCS
jgi:hypothetical protein